MYKYTRSIDFLALLADCEADCFLIGCVLMAGTLSSGLVSIFLLSFLLPAGCFIYLLFVTYCYLISHVIRISQNHSKRENRKR